MVWLEFLLSAVIITFVANQLAKFADAIAIRTHLGGVFVGTLLVAGSTSLPELITMISAINQGYPDLAAGNLFGSSMFNMFMLAVLDIVHYKQRILRKAAMKHSLSGSLAGFLTCLAVFFILADIPAKVGWVGLDSIALILAYLAGIFLIQSQVARPVSTLEDKIIPEEVPSLRRSILGFGFATLVLVFVTPWMVSSSVRIAEITGLGATFIGSTLVAVVTSLPEMVTTISAARIGADDMAISNLFGSNMFNMFALALTDIVYLQGRFLGVIDDTFVIIGMLGLIMIFMGLIGNIARIERRFLFVEVDALMLIMLYFGGLFFLYTRGLSP